MLHSNNVNVSEINNQNWLFPADMKHLKCVISQKYFVSYYFAKKCFTMQVFKYNLRLFKFPTTIIIQKHFSVKYLVWIIKIKFCKEFILLRNVYSTLLRKFDTITETVVYVWGVCMWVTWNCAWKMFIQSQKYEVFV